MTGKRTPLDGLAGPELEKARRADRERQYEEELVGYIFSRYKLPGALRRELESEMEARTGNRRLTMEMFHERFPSFPVYLSARKFSKIAEDSTLHRLFNNFGQRKIVRAYMDLLESVPDIAAEKPVGLVFPWPHLGTSKDAFSGAKDTNPVRSLVLHNRGMDDEVHGVRLLWLPDRRPNEERDQEPPPNLLLETISVFLQSVDRTQPGGRWSP